MDLSVDFPVRTDPEIVIPQFNLPFHTTFNSKIFFDFNSPLMNADSFTLAVIGKCIQLSDPQVEQTRLPEIKETMYEWRRSPHTIRLDPPRLF